MLDRATLPLKPDYRHLSCWIMPHFNDFILTGLYLQRPDFQIRPHSQVLGIRLQYILEGHNSIHSNELISHAVICLSFGSSTKALKREHNWCIWETRRRTFFFFCTEWARGRVEGSEISEIREEPGDSPWEALWDISGACILIFLRFFSFFFFCLFKKENSWG